MVQGAAAMMVAACADSAVTGRANGPVSLGARSLDSATDLYSIYQTLMSRVSEFLITQRAVEFHEQQRDSRQTVAKRNIRLRPGWN